MLDLLHGTMSQASRGGTCRKKEVDMIIISCGVNNVLSGHLVHRFGLEVESLINELDAVLSEAHPR